MSENSTEDVALLQSGLVLEEQQRCFEKKKRPGTWPFFTSLTLIIFYSRTLIYIHDHALYFVQESK